MNASRAFYKEMLGFDETGWGTGDFTSFSRDNAVFYSCNNGQGYAGTWIWIRLLGDIVAYYSDLIVYRTEKYSDVQKMDQSALMVKFLWY